MKELTSKRNWPKISVITPSFNQGQFLEQTIRSVLLQDYPNLEYIIIDGGSKDNSVDIIKKYEKSLAYWVSEPDSGHGNALNKGFSRATGEIMCWINSDDMYTESSFYTVADIFDSYQDIKWIMGTPTLWDKNDVSTKTFSVHKNIYDFILGRYGWIQQESTFWRKSLWDEAGGKINENYRLMVDGELWCRFFLLTELWHVDAKLGGYREHDTNRAKIYAEQIIVEMEKAVIELRHHCSMRVKLNMAKLRIIRIIRRLCRKLKREGLLDTFLAKFCRDINYKKLIKKNGDWVKTNLAFEWSLS